MAQKEKGTIHFDVKEFAQVEKKRNLLIQQDQKIKVLATRLAIGLKSLAADARQNSETNL